MLAYTWSCRVLKLSSCDLFLFTMVAGRIEESLSQDKIDHINNIYQEELDYWKRTALERASDQNDTNQLEDLAPPSLFVTREATKSVKNVKKTDIDEIIFSLKSRMFW